MAYTVKQYASAFCEAIQNKTKTEAEKAAENLIVILKKNHQIALAKKIAKEFEIMALQKRGVVIGKFWSAHKIDESIIKSIATKISDKLKTENIKQLHFEERLDKDMIGGFKIKISDILIDATVLGALQKIKKELNK